jgi:hypothetical protein
MFNLITDLIIFCKKKLGLPLTPVPNHQVYQLLKDSTDSRVIPSRFRKRIKLMVLLQTSKYLKKSKPGDSILYAYLNLLSTLQLINFY